MCVCVSLPCCWAGLGCAVLCWAREAASRLAQKNFPVGFLPPSQTTMMADAIRCFRATATAMLCEEEQARW